MNPLPAILLDIGKNIILVISLLYLNALLFNFSQKSKNPIVIEATKGILFGLTAIIAMNLPVHIAEGIIIDARVVLAALAGVFGGPWAGGIASLMAAGYRYYLGGVGALAGSGAILVGGLMGIVLGQLMNKRRQIPTAQHCFMLGVGLGMEGLLWVFALPADMIAPTFQTLAIPIMISYPLMTVIFGSIINQKTQQLYLTQELQQSQKLMREFIDASVDAYHFLDKDFNIQIINQMAFEALALGQPRFQKMSDVIGEYFFDVYPFLVEAGRYDNFAHTLKTGESQRWRANLPHPTMGQMHLEVDTYKVGNGIGVTVRDITQLIEVEEKYREFVEATSDLVTRVDDEGNFLYVNHMASRVFGVTPEECLGRSAFDFIHPDDRIATIDAFQTWISEKQNQVTYDNRQMSVTGQVNHFLWTITLHYNERNEISYINSIGSNITERKAAEQERERLLTAEKYERTLAETLSDITLAFISQTDIKLLLEEILNQIQRIVPFNAGNIIYFEGGKLELGAWVGYDVDNPEQFFLEDNFGEFILEKEAFATRQPVTLQDTYEDPRWVVVPETSWIRAFLCLPIMDEDQALGVIRLDSEEIGTFSEENAQRLMPLANAAAVALKNARLHQRSQHEITERKRAEAQLLHLATHDVLTDLPNRALFLDRLSHGLKLAKRTNAQLAVLYIDIDDFKSVNDAYGHQHGDELLRRIAQRMAGAIRESDTLARMGGDEFVMLLENVTNREDVTKRVEEIVSELNQPFNLKHSQFHITISVGITLYPEDGDNIEILLQNADQAMYIAKTGGKQRYQFFSPDMRTY